MTADTRLYLQGYARPLSEWSDRALSQIYLELKQTLSVETRGSAKRALEGSLAILVAEGQRRMGTLTPERVDQLRKDGALVTSLSDRRAIRVDRTIDPSMLQRRLLDRSLDSARDDRSTDPDRRSERDTGPERE